jgi:SWIM/SEC-C metal-binding protein
MYSFQSLGTEENPIRVRVHDEEQANKVLHICDSLEQFVEIEVSPDQKEDNLGELFFILERELGNLPADLFLPNPPKPNNFCPCGSNKKFKKCCLNTASSPVELTK